MSQEKLVLQHLQEHGSITSLEAIKLFGATRLSAIIYNLRHNEGHKIVTEIETVPTRHGTHSNIARYKIKEAKTNEKSS